MKAGRKVGAKLSALAIVSCSLLSAAASARTLVLCTDEAGPAAERSKELVEQHLPEMQVELRPCAPAETPDSPATLIASFEEDEGGRVLLVLTSASSQRRSRMVPWLETRRKPLSQTARERRLASLALLVETLIADIAPIDLAEAPAPPRPPATDPFVQPEITEPDGAPEPLALRWTVSTLAGATVMHHGIWAPAFGLDVSVVFERFGAWLAAAIEPDSTFAIGSRPFDTLQAGLSAGIEGVVLRFERLVVAGRLGLLWQRSYFERADIESAKRRSWSDLAVSLSAVARIRAVGPAGFTLQSGVELYPSPRRATIEDGPGKRVNAVTLPLLAGLFVSF